MTVFDRIRIRLWKKTGTAFHLNMIRRAGLPRSREFLAYVMNHGNGTERADAAARMAACPETRGEAVRCAGETQDKKILAAVFHELQYPGEREEILELAAKDPEKLMDSAVRKAERQEGPEAVTFLARGNVYPEYAVRRLSDRKVLEDIALHSGNEEARLAAVKKLEYPLSRDTLLQVIRDYPGESAEEEALEKIPFDREEEALRPMVPGSRRLQLMIARTGSCPMCGERVQDECNAERLGDDLEDGLVYDHQYLCPRCSWSGYEREWIDKPWD